VKIPYFVVVLGLLSGSTIFFWWNDPPTLLSIPGHNYGEQTVIGTIIVAVLTLIVVRALRPR
jgi:preprotein translocase subunit SecE